MWIPATVTATVKGMKNPMEVQNRPQAGTDLVAMKGWVDQTETATSILPKTKKTPITTGNVPAPLLTNRTTYAQSISRRFQRSSTVLSGFKILICLTVQPHTSSNPLSMCSISISPTVLIFTSPPINVCRFFICSLIHLPMSVLSQTSPKRASKSQKPNSRHHLSHLSGFWLI